MVNIYRSLTSVTLPSRSLYLDKALVLPQLQNNLLSIAKLFRFNNVSVEFFPHHFVVKDLRTGMYLMSGMNVNDV